MIVACIYMFHQLCAMTLHVSVCPPSVTHAPSHKLLSAPT